MGWWGPDALAVVGPTGVCLLDLFCSGGSVLITVGSLYLLCLLFGLYLCVIGDGAMEG